MGLLDDAIREHLELKRKHGADPDDLARQEREALGPGMRNEFAQPEGEEPAAEAAPAPEPESESEVAAYAAPPAEDPEPPLNQEPPPAPAQPEPGYDEDPWLADERDEVPADEALQAKPSGEEDVLEET